jgi:hypothetical protein
MRIRVVGILLLLVAGPLTLSLTRGQERPGTPDPGKPAAPAAPPAGAPPLVKKPALAPRDFSKLSPLQKQLLLSAQGGADWLSRMNGENGRFLQGYLPALAKPLEGEHFLRQAGAAFALARAARFSGEERYAARATQAVLALLLDTAVVSKEGPKVRQTVLPPGVVNRLGGAALLVLAINELPAPQADLLEPSEQLCNYLRAQARPDGSLAVHEAGDAPTEDDVNSHPGLALYALMLSQKHRPAAWKLDVVRKALPFYRAWWRAHKNMGFVPDQTAAYAEAYLQCHERPFADFVNEMSDWVCSLQYPALGSDLRRVLWCGGFMTFADGRPVETAPHVGGAVYAEGLAQACRVAREAGDLERHSRYGEALAGCLQFLSTLQYTATNTRHFAPWYRERLLGAFHASHQDGNLRLENTQHAVSALVLYLEDVVR